MVQGVVLIITVAVEVDACVPSGSLISASSQKTSACEIKSQVDDLEAHQFTGVRSGPKPGRPGVQGFLEPVHQCLGSKFVIGHKGELCRCRLERVERILKKTSKKLLVLSGKQEPSGKWCE